MKFNEVMCAIDMRLILKLTDSINAAIDEGRNVGLRFSGSLGVIESDGSVKEMIDLDEDIVFYIPAAGSDLANVTDDAESDGAK